MFDCIPILSCGWGTLSSPVAENLDMHCYKPLPPKHWIVNHFCFLGAINIGLIAPNLMVDHHLSHCLMAVCPLVN